MWLLNGEAVPSVATIKRFLSEHLGEVVEDLFYQFVEKLYEMKEVQYKNLFMDGTKLEARLSVTCERYEYAEVSRRVMKHLCVKHSGSILYSQKKN